MVSEPDLIRGLGFESPLFVIYYSPFVDLKGREGLYFVCLTLQVRAHEGGC